MNDGKHGLEKLAIIYSLPYALLMWRWVIVSLRDNSLLSCTQHVILPCGILLRMV